MRKKDWTAFRAAMVIYWPSPTHEAKYSKKDLVTFAAKWSITNIKSLLQLEEMNRGFDEIVFWIKKAKVQELSEEDINFAFWASLNEHL